jgi:hypothetical protein
MLFHQGGITQADTEITNVCTQISTHKRKRSRRLVGKSKIQRRKFRQRFNSYKSILENNVVVNLSSYKLNLHELSVINKGLGFVPYHLRIPFNSLDKDLKLFERRLQLHYFFTSNGYVNNDAPRCFEANPDWWPRNLNPFITSYCLTLKKLIANTLRRKSVTNLSFKEIAALKNLKTNPNLVFKRCDKGGGVAVLDKFDYICKIECMLSDTVTYTETSNNDCSKVKSNADALISNLTIDGFLTRKQYIHLTSFAAKCPVFYGLPKIHKPNCPYRPIVSQINGPTWAINKLVDKYLYVAEKCIPYLLQDTTAFLLLLEKNKNCYSHTFLVTMDVVSLYTNIPHSEGIEWVSEFYDETLPRWQDFNVDIVPIDKQSLITLLSFILDNCTFEFNGRFYKQNFGTTMGAIFSVKYANIYMYMWFRKKLALYTGPKPEFISRLVDDCFFVWNLPESELLNLFTFFNSCHNSIKFTFSFSHDKITFLDTVTYIEKCLIKTTVYIKPSDKKQYLFFSSSHPRHIFRAIPYSQALRYRRIIVDDELFKSELNNLKLLFVKRGYPDSLITDRFNEVLTIKRDTVLRYKSVTEKKLEFERFLGGRSFLSCIIMYHSAFNSSFRRSFNSLWLKFIQYNENISNVFEGEIPQLIFRRGITLGNILVRAKLKSSNVNLDNSTVDVLLDLLRENDTVITSSPQPTVSKCNSKRCLCCDFIVTGSSFHDRKRSVDLNITNSFNCNSTNVIYLISCKKCAVQYIGQTGRTLRDRLNNHRSTIITRKKTAIAIHFNEPFHCLNDLTIMPIHSLEGMAINARLELENSYMIKLNTKYPNGLNCFPLL